jgi:hypothetical protein
MTEMSRNRSNKEGLLGPGNYFAQKIEVKAAKYLMVAYLLFSSIFILSY